LQGRDQRGDVPVELDRRRDQEQLSLEGRQPEHAREAVDGRLEPVLGLRRRLEGDLDAISECLEQRPHALHLDHERRLLELCEDGRHAGTATDCEGSNTGGSTERSTSRLSTPSTVRRTHCAPGGTTPSWNVSVEVCAGCGSAAAVS